MQFINSLIMLVTDPLFGWLLNLPRDLALFIIAIGTALVLTVVRIWTTDQTTLKHCKKDKQTIKKLLKEAKKAKNKPRIKQLQATMQQIAMKSFVSEGKPLLASLLPVILIATWSMNRIGYLPPDGNSPIEVTVFSPVLAINNLVHAVPQDGIVAATGWIQNVHEERNPAGKIVAGVARWALDCEPREAHYNLEFRHGTQTLTTELTVNGKTYSPPITAYGSDPNEVIQIKLSEYKPFGIIPGFFGMAPWIIGYLIFVVPIALFLKPLLRIQ